MLRKDEKGGEGSPGKRQATTREARQFLRIRSQLGGMVDLRWHLRTFVLGLDKSAVVPLQQRKAAESYQHRAGQVTLRSSLETSARR